MSAALNLTSALLTFAMLQPTTSFADPDRPGGDTTVSEIGRNAFSLPAANLPLLKRDGFFIGNSFFKSPWVSAPASTTARDGLGPYFDSNTCQACHVKDGRGRPPLQVDDPIRSMVLRLSIATELQDVRIASTPEPSYGGHFSLRSIQTIRPEGVAALRYVPVELSVGAGSSRVLLEPSIEFVELNHGAMNKDTRVSLRVAPAMIGMGLLEAIEQSDIESQADPDDANGDNISGRVNRVFDRTANKFTVGRFGWKATEPSVIQQTAAAFHGDMGLTTRLFPDEACTTTQTDCARLPTGGTPEVTDELLQFVAFYAQHLAVPRRRNSTASDIVYGGKAFTKAGCASCHTPSYTTGTVDNFPQLSNQKIYPYTDLLLHDMGDALGDGHREYQASGSEWRTPPLWGVGLIETVNGHSRLLHDGRARGVEEAILWHGGEGAESRAAYLKLNPATQRALVRFVNSL